MAEELDSQNIDQLADEVAGSEDLLDVVNRPPVIRLVNDILFRALQMRASDIHIHPFETKIVVRYRIDGILYDTLTLNRNVLSAGHLAYQGHGGHGHRRTPDAAGRPVQCSHRSA